VSERYVPIRTVRCIARRHRALAIFVIFREWISLTNRVRELLPSSIDTF